MLLQDSGCTINYRHLSICGLCIIAQEGESVIIIGERKQGLVVLGGQSSNLETFV